MLFGSEYEYRKSWNLNCIVLPTEVQRRNHIRHYKTHFLRLFWDASSVYSQFPFCSALFLLHQFLRRVKPYSRNKKDNQKLKHGGKKLK